MPLLEIHARCNDDQPPAATLTLPFDARQRSRLRATLDDGREAGLFLPRGSVLRDGDRLLASTGEVVEVRAAHEVLSQVRAAGPVALARAAYHLGNRHVALQITESGLAYRHDHVLDEMVRGLGLVVEVAPAPFEPEAGAYAGHHAHAHGEHTHGHGHA